MNWPAFLSRKYLRAAFVTIIVPKRFVSICARNSDRGVSSRSERRNVPTCRQDLIARRKTRFTNCATQTARTTSDQPYLRHSSSYLALLRKFHAREIRAGGNVFVLLD